MSDIEIPELDNQGLRKFALTMAFMITAIFGVGIPWIFDLSWPVWPWALAGVLVLFGVIVPGSLKQVYYLWMRFGLLLNKVTSPIILGVLFFGIILPFGLVRRLGKDPLNKRFDPDLTTYRTPSVETEKNSLENPY